EQPDLSNILATVNQLQLNNQAFQQNNVDLRNILNYIHTQGHLVICMQPNCYLNDQLQAGLLGSLLTGLALNWFAPLLEKQSPLLETFEDLVKEFEATFGDSEKSRTAANKIRKLIQGSKPASSYASEFQQIAVEDPISLNDAISKAVRTSQQDSINLSPLLGQHCSKSPMQIDSMKIGLLSGTEKKQCRTNNLCFYCDNPGHIVKNCLKKPKLPPRIDTIISPEEPSGTVIRVCNA
ncbi:16180_t:CDS:2, partial [Cetraspora pellucida]